MLSSWTYTTHAYKFESSFSLKFNLTINGYSYSCAKLLNRKFELQVLKLLWVARGHFNDMVAKFNKVRQNVEFTDPFNQFVQHSAESLFL